MTHCVVYKYDDVIFWMRRSLMASFAAKMHANILMDTNWYTNFR